MAIAAGKRLGAFEVLSVLGRGGMGEVYRARDSRLSREVALKVLPESLARDPDRIARFEREARVLGSLNHPHIAAVHGFEQSDGRRYLVLELVPGQTLAEMLAHGPLEVREALQIARQIAEGLEEAHAKGVVHRDLKPANVKVTPEGRVKVLDFGLAKALADERAEVSLDDSPTLTHSVESAGVILGTAGYMSPEQARGRVVDKRTDIWAFGCLLYEMLAGRRLFSGPSTTDALAAILTMEPDWSRLPERTPPNVRILLRRCLQKDQNSRLHDIADARLEIEEALAAETSGITAVPLPPPSPRRLVTHGLAFGVGVLVGAVAVFLAMRSRPAPGAIARFNISLPAEGRMQNNLQAVCPIALSADASRIVYVGRRPDGRTQVFLRRMDRLAPEPVPGTEGAFLPFLSPDGEWLGFASEGKLKKIALAGGQAAVISDAPDPRGASWGDDGTILYTPNNAGGLSRLRASEGTAQPGSSPDRAKKEDGHRWPRFLPGAKAALFSVQPESGRESQRTIEALDLVSGQRRTIVRGGSYPVYAGGFLFFGRAGQVFAAPFDAQRLQTQGEPQAVVDDVRMDPKNTGVVYFDVSAAGAAVYVPGFARPKERNLVYVDRSGRTTPVTAAKRPYFGPAISPDGRRVAVTVEGLEDTLWVLEVASGTLSRLTFDGDVSGVRWTPDGRSLVYLGNAEGSRTAYRVAADGGGKPEVVFGRDEWWINDAAPRPDGSGTLVCAQDMRGQDLYFVRKGGGTAEPFLVTPSDERQPDFSPNGSFLVYASNETDRYEVYVRPFPGPGPKRQVSTAGGILPHWARDGREVFYWEVGQVARLMKVTFEAGSEPKIGPPEPLFEAPLAMVDDYGVTPDGRFVMVKREAEEENPLQIVVVPGFLDEMRARFAGKRP
jgi:eukaryotic-like serine/threonine-protein kinase